MENITKQDRITLKNLKVADFASEETMCFSATVVFDGTPIAEARNDGHGGSTFLHALKGKAALLTQAEAFAKGLPPAPIDLGQEGEDPHYIDMTLDFLVDELADAMHAERKVRSAFNRDIGNKVLFIKDGKLKFLKGIKLKAIADRKAYFASLRARQAQPIVSREHITVDTWHYLANLADLATPEAMLFIAFRVPSSPAIGVKLISTPWKDQNLEHAEGITAEQLRQEHRNKGMPDDLANILELAGQADVRILILDADAPALLGLPLAEP